LEKRVAVGKIINTHGIRGGLKVEPLSDIPERFKLLRRVFLEKDGQEEVYHVREGFLKGRFWVLYLEEVSEVDRARRLVNSLITIPLSERPELPADNYYLDEIIGLDVVTKDGAFLGKVGEILQTGSNDVYVVQMPDRQSEDILIPALKSVVKKIDREAGCMVVDLPEGLI